jgi:flagellar basal body L-ring protein FlgH
MDIRHLTLMAAAGIGLAGCNVSDAPPSDDAATTTTASDTGVTREPMAAPEPAPVARMPAQAAIQSQPGPDGAQVDLLKVAVTGDILTVTLRCSSDQKINSQSFNVDKISVIDDSTSQRLGVLKDDKADWMASNVSGNFLRTDCEVKPGIFWVKFPAPPVTSPTVSINLPEVGPFDGVPVTR